MAADSVIVSGIVFDDRDSDGSRDSGERGLAGVAVSDGAATALTDRHGRYTLLVDTVRRRTDLVFVSVPEGYTTPPDQDMVPQFYRTVPSEVTSATIDFGLRRDDRARDRDYRFIGLADVHVQAGTTNNKERFSDQLAQINELVDAAAEDRHDGYEAPRFAVVSGDLTNNATPAEFADYRAATATSRLPVWPAIGNHEYNFQIGPTYADIVDNYRRAVGPEWYSFTYGGKHFVMLDNIRGLSQAEQFAWLQQDLALHGRGRQVVVITHIPLNTGQTTDAAFVPQYTALFEQYHTTLLLAGHTHSNDVDDAVIDGAMHAVTNSASYTIDGTQNGFRVVEFDDGRVEIPFRQFDAKQPSLALVAPADGGRLPRARTTVQVNAYHTSSEIAEVQFRVDGSGSWRKLKPSGSWTWSASYDARGLRTGEHRIAVRVTAAGGRTWSREGTFRVVSPQEIAAPQQGTDWPTFHGDARRSGVAADGIDSPLGLAWSHRTGGSILTSSPAAVDDVVYVGVRDENGTSHNGVLALDLDSGERRWWRHTDAQVDSSPTVAGGLVLASSIRGTLYALDARTGAVRWQYRVGAEPVRRAWMYFSPAVADGVVYQAYSTAEGGTRVAALDLATGALRWESPNIGANWHSKGSVAIGDELIYVVAQGGRVTALDRATGAQRWTVSVGGWVYGAPMLAGDLLLVPFPSDNLAALDAATGAQRWRYHSPGPSHIAGGSMASTPAVADGVGYVGFTDGRVSAIDLATGQPRWIQQTGHAVQSSPVVSGDLVYVGSNDGWLRGFDRETGQPLWQYELGTWLASSPAVSGNALVVGAWDGNVYAFTPTGEAAPARWSRITGTVAGSSPVAGARVVVRDGDGAVVGDVRADAGGRFTVAVPVGSYTVASLHRGHLPAARAVEVAGDGETYSGDLSLTPITAPVAGRTDLSNDTGAASTRLDTSLGREYAFVANEHVLAVIGSTTAANNLEGTFQPGWLADMTLSDETATEVLDWSEHILTTAGPGDPPWGRSGEWLPLPDIRIDGAKVIAAGSPQVAPAIDAELTYEAVPGLPAVKLSLSLTNTGSEDFSGHYQYLLDPDSSDDTVIVPGVAQQNPGYLSAGWTANYVYDGPRTATGSPAQGLAWPAGQQPVTLSAHGYICGAWFDASVAAGESRTITWYHITDYPAAGADVTANIAQWAAALSALP